MTRTSLAPRTTAPRSSTWPAASSAPASPTPTCHPIQGGLERLRCDLSELSTREEYLAAITAYADRAPRPASGSSAAAGRCRRSRAARRPRPTSTRSCPTGRCSCPTATTTAPGSTAARLEIAGIDRAHARPARRPHRARRRRPPQPAPCTRARRRWCRGTSRAPRARTTTPRCWRASATCTRSASRPGRTPSSAPTPGMDDPGATYVEGGRATATSARTSSARCGGSAGSGSSRSPTWSAAARR